MSAVALAGADPAQQMAQVRARLGMACEAQAAAIEAESLYRMQEHWGRCDEALDEMMDLLAQLEDGGHLEAFEASLRTTGRR